MRKRIIYPLLVIVLTLSCPAFLYAQGDLPEVNDVPIDGGLSLLLAAGVGYGIKKARDNRKAKKDITPLDK